MTVTVGIGNNWYSGFKAEPGFFTPPMLCVCLLHDDLYHPQGLRPQKYI